MGMTDLVELCPWGCTPVVYFNCKGPTHAFCKKHSKMRMPIMDWNRRPQSRPLPAQALKP